MPSSLRYEDNIAKRVLEVRFECDNFCRNTSPSIPGITTSTITISNVCLFIASTASVPEAVEAMKRQTFDIVIVDVVMPGMDGDVFLQKLSHSKRTSRTRFAILSSYLNEDGIRDRLKRLKSRIYIL